MASKKLAKWGWLGLGLGWLGLGWLTRLILIFIKEKKENALYECFKQHWSLVQRHLACQKSKSITY